MTRKPCAQVGLGDIKLEDKQTTPEVEEDDVQMDAANEEAKHEQARLNILFELIGDIS